MASIWDFVIETSSGTTDDAAATFVDLLHWKEAVWSLRRRAPHGLTLRVPRDGTALLSDFVAGREIRTKRNGVYWSPGAGFMDAASIPGGSDGGEIIIPGWGNAYALLLSKNNTFPGSAYQILSATWDADSAFGSFLNDAHHYGTTDWFPSAQRTIGTAGTSMTTARTFSSISALEALYSVADIEGWPVRFGINSSGTFTIKSSGTTDQDLTASIHLYDGAPGVKLTNYQADGHAIVSQVWVVCRTPNIRTQLNGLLLATATTVTVDSTAGLVTGDWVSLGQGTANEESREITVTSATQFTVSALTNNHADNETVQTLTDMRFRATQVSAATTVNDAHHLQEFVIFNDSLVTDDMRSAVGEAYIAAYDHPLVRATYRVTDSTTIEQLLDAGLEPGDLVKATSEDRDLSLVYSNTTVLVQEMTVTLTDGVCSQIDVVLGDPALDSYATLERGLAAGRVAATMVYA